MKVYLVGGAVRDELLGRPVIDKDYVVVGATPEQMIKLGYTQVGKDFPVFLHPQTKDEYALARTERKHGQGYGGFICDFSPSITLEEDLYRRDLTVNAIAKDENGKLVDPFNGQDDLNNKVLRHVGPAFSEDPLRVLRVARFAARYHYLGFTIAPETLTLMETMVAQGELATLTKERVWLEIEKCLKDGCVAVFSDVLQQTSALELILPMLKNWDQERSEWLTQRVNLLPKEHTHFQLIQFCLWLAHSELDTLEDIEQTHKVPVKYAQSARDFCRYQHLLYQDKLDAQALLAFFNALDIWRRPERFSLFCDVAKTFDPVCKNHISNLMEAAQCALSVDVQAIIKQGYTGVEIKLQLAQKRLNTIHAKLNDTTSDN
jgi:tRNA nucleotidyltransferase (CCA-adding enzyme)